MNAFTPVLTPTFPLTVTLTAPLHHGAGSAGNTSLLRTQEIVLPDGSTARVPFVSANSVRHGLRDALAWHAVRTLQIADGSLAKAVVDLLWSGGAVTTTGAQTNLEMARRINAIFPALGLLGYAAQSDIISGTLRVSDFVLVCQENAWRLPAGLQEPKKAAAFRTEEFGTRHDVGRSAVQRFVSAVADATGTQMIYDVQAITAGARLYGEVSLTPAATAGHRLALGAALALWAPDGKAFFGAKSATGYGAAMVDGLPADDSLGQWTEHVESHGAEIVALLDEVAN